MTNGRYIDIENEVLRTRLQEHKAAIDSLVKAVREYARGECLRSRLLNTADAAEQVARGGVRR